MSSLFPRVVARRSRRAGGLLLVDEAARRLPVGWARRRGLSDFATGPSHHLPVLRGVVFDMDGTLTKANFDFAELYRRVGCDPSTDVLDEVARWPEAERLAAHRVIADFEAEAASTLELAEGAADCARFLDGAGIKMAMVTRNSATTVLTFERGVWADLPAFALTISRDGISKGFQEPIPPKPHPYALDLIARRWALPRAELLMVGDSPSNDVAFGHAANVPTALVDSGRRLHEAERRKVMDHAALLLFQGPTFVVDSLAQLPDVVKANYILPSTIPVLD